MSPKPPPAARARRTCLAPRALVGLLALVACASSPPEPVQRSAAPQPAASLDAPRSEPTPAADAEAPLPELEASLAAYEQQLARNEARLQAMGVRLAQRPEPAVAGQQPGSRVNDDERFAPPPPAAPGDAAAATRSAREPEGDNKKVARKNASRADEVAKAPAPRPGAGNGGLVGSGRAAGGAPAGPAKAAEEASKRDRDDGRCAEICGLADSTCELEAKICDLAARHPGEPRFEAVCRRAEDDCRVASDACTLCSP